MVAFLASNHVEGGKLQSLSVDSIVLYPLYGEIKILNMRVMAYFFIVHSDSVDNFRTSHTCRDWQCFSGRAKG
jgi:hypothetical protein